MTDLGAFLLLLCDFHPNQATTTPYSKSKCTFLASPQVVSIRQCVEDRLQGLLSMRYVTFCSRPPPFSTKKGTIHQVCSFLDKRRQASDMYT